MHESDGGDEPVRHRPNPADPAAPLQLGDIQADDALIDALGSGSLRATDALATSDDVDDRLAAMLASWVAAVQEPPANREAAIAEAAAAAPLPATTDATPDADAPDAPAAGTTDVRSARHRRRRDRPGYVVRLSAAAVVAIAVTGGIAVGNADTARPGDVLWPVAKVFYREHARSVEAADTVAVHLERARTALREGRTADAAREVNDMQAALAVILPADGRADLDAQHTSIVAIVAATPDAVLLDPQLRAPVVPDVAGAEALGLPRAPGLPDPSTTAVLPPEALTSTVPPVTSGGPSTSDTGVLPPAVTAPVEPPPASDPPPIEEPTDTAPVEPPPYIPPRTDPPAVDPGTDGGGSTDSGAQSQAPADPPATTEAPVEQPVAAGTDSTGTDSTGTDSGSTGDDSGTSGSTEGASDSGGGDSGGGQGGAQDQDTNAQGSDSGGSGSPDSGGSLLSVSADASLGVGGVPVSGSLDLNLG